MFINITNNGTADNKGSSTGLVHYLDKENRLAGGSERESWFNEGHRDISSYQAMRAIDNNIAKLGKADAKFFLVNISPSQKEIAWLKEQFGDAGAKEQLKQYAVKMMDEYARNFKRPGIESSEDLLWFAKLENQRHYSYKDWQVTQGFYKAGDPKPGEQMHIQVIVSRKDITNTVKLSPMNNSKGRNAEHARRMGQFDRSAFKESGERIFDELFSFKRGVQDSYAYANARKKGFLEQRIALRSGLRENRTTVSTELHSLPFTADSLAMVLTRPGQEAAPDTFNKKKRKREGPDQEHEISF